MPFSNIVYLWLLFFYLCGWSKCSLFCWRRDRSLAIAAVGKWSRWSSRFCLISCSGQRTDKHDKIQRHLSPSILRIVTYEILLLCPHQVGWILWMMYSFSGAEVKQTCHWLCFILNSVTDKYFSVQCVFLAGRWRTIKISFSGCVDPVGLVALISANMALGLS